MLLGKKITPVAADVAPTVGPQATPDALEVQKDASTSEDDAP